MQRIDVAEVAKLGKDNAQSAADQSVKLEDVKQDDPMEVDIKDESLKQESRAGLHQVC